MPGFLTQSTIDALLKESDSKDENYINMLHELKNDFNTVQERYINDVNELLEKSYGMAEDEINSYGEAFEKIQNKYRAYPENLYLICPFGTNFKRDFRAIKPEQEYNDSFFEYAQHVYDHRYGWDDQDEY